MKKLFLTALALFMCVVIFGQYDYKINKRTGRFDMVNELIVHTETITLTVTGINDTVTGKFTALDGRFGFDYDYHLDFSTLDDTTATVDFQDSSEDANYLTLSSTLFPLLLDEQEVLPVDEAYVVGCCLRKYNQAVLYTHDCTSGTVVITLRIRQNE